MSVEKAEIKMAVVHDLGCGFDDERERAEQDVLRHAGGAKSLRDAAKAVEVLLAHIAREFKGEKITPAQAESATLYVKRSAEICRNLALAAEVAEQRAHGRVEAYRSVIKTTKQIHDAEQKKIESLRSGEEGPRAVGEHPGESEAARRREEAMASTPEMSVTAQGTSEVEGGG